MPWDGCAGEDRQVIHHNQEAYLLQGGSCEVREKMLHEEQLEIKGSIFPQVNLSLDLLDLVPQRQYGNIWLENGVLGLAQLCQQSYSVFSPSPNLHADYRALPAITRRGKIKKSGWVHMEE